MCNKCKINEEGVRGSKRVGECRLQQVQDQRRGGAGAACNKCKIGEGEGSAGWVRGEEVTRGYGRKQELDRTLRA